MIKFSAKISLLVMMGFSLNAMELQTTDIEKLRGMVNNEQPEKFDSYLYNKYKEDVDSRRYDKSMIIQKFKENSALISDKLASPKGIVLLTKVNNFDARMNKKNQQYEEHYLKPNQSYFIDIDNKKIIASLSVKTTKKELKKYVQVYFYDLANMLMILNPLTQSHIRFSVEKLPNSTEFKDVKNIDLDSIIKIFKENLE